VDHASEHVIAALTAARREKGLTQRELSRLTGVPQSHISKIERGAVDIQLSSLIELARVLDLEVMPVPRKLVPAVQSVVRSGVSSTLIQAANNRRARRYLRRIQKEVNRFHEVRDSRVLPDLRRTVTELEGLPIGSRELETIHRISESLGKIPSGPETQSEIQRVTHELRRVRNKLAHDVADSPTPVRPAYTLDEGEDNA
jgi:transcriptional regulator with XRE-family HTH domain